MQVDIKRCVNSSSKIIPLVIFLRVNNLHFILPARNVEDWTAIEIGREFCRVQRGRRQDQFQGVLPACARACTESQI